MLYKGMMATKLLEPTAAKKYALRGARFRARARVFARIQPALWRRNAGAK